MSSDLDDGIDFQWGLNIFLDYATSNVLSCELCSSDISSRFVGALLYIIHLHCRTAIAEAELEYNSNHRR